MATTERRRLENMARQVLKSTNRKYGEHHVFLPDGRKYPFQCYWDSAFQAIVAARFWPERAEKEFFSLYSKQFEDGRVPHLVCWEKPSFLWRILCYGGGWVERDGRAALSTQPMASAFCAWEVYTQTKNKSFLEKLLPYLESEADYVLRKRDLLGQGLTANINCMEAGTDESPVYDEVMGVKGEHLLGLIHYGLKLARHIRAYRRAGNSLEQIKNTNLFVVEDLCNNSLLCRSLRSLADIHHELGNVKKADEFQKKAKTLADCMETLCWDEKEGIFLTRYLKDGNIKISRTHTLSSVLPLFTGMMSKEKARRMVEEHILNKGEFYSHYPLSFVSMRDPRERSGWKPFSLPILWRGGVWVNMNWMLVKGLREYGYHDAASDIAQKTAAMILKEGAFREFYDSRTGKGYGGKSYGWSTLALDMLKAYN